MTQGEVEEGTTAHGVEADGVALWASRAAIQWSGRRSSSCPAGVVGMRVSTSCRPAHGSTPNRWHVDVKLKSTPAVWPPRGEPTVNHFFGAMALRLVSRSDPFFSF